MIYMIRHGQTEMNTHMLLQGRSDSPLNEKGIAQAQEAAERLKRKFLNSTVLFRSTSMTSTTSFSLTARKSKAQRSHSARSISMSISREESLYGKKY